MATENQSADSSSSSRVTAFPEALSLAALSASAYWIAFVYQVSYLNFFDLPADLAEVSIQSILLVAAALVLGPVTLWSFNFISLFLSPDPSKTANIFYFAVLPLALLAWVMSFGFTTQDWWIYLICILPALCVLSFRFFFHEYWVRYADLRRSTEPRTLMRDILHAFGPRAYGMVAMLILFSIIVWIYGRAKAETQKEYFLLSDYPEIAVIRIYSDRILAVPFDRGNKTFRPELIIRKIDEKDIRLRLDKSVGPLTRQK